MLALQDLSVHLHDLFSTETLLFCSWEPNDLDSTTFSKLFLKFKLQTLKGKTYVLNVNTNNAFLLQKLFAKISENKQVYLLGHNWKEVFSFFSRITGQKLKLNNAVDLDWIESYLKYEPSRNNIKLQVQNFKKCWSDKKLWSIYKSIYEVLICDVIPTIESCGLLNDNLGQIVFPNYHIEGQENGRLSCSCSFKRCYNPHSLGEVERTELVPIEKNSKFIIFDFRNMEVSVLAHLAQDDVLLDICENNPSQVYEVIFEKITGIKNHTDARNMGKKMFLPCIYGQTEIGLALNLDISREQSSIYINKSYQLFQKSFAFVEAKQKQASENNQVEDCFGRKRLLQNDECHKAKNFAIQSPSALICLEALKNLHQDSGDLYKIAFHVHDGYCIIAQDINLQDAYHVAKKSLTKRSNFIPDLKLNVSAKLGKNLNHMVKIGK